MSKYIFMTADGKYIGMDQASGGYPYETDDLFSAKPWSSREAAMNYEKHFKEKSWHLFLVKGLDLLEMHP